MGEGRQYLAMTGAVVIPLSLGVAGAGAGRDGSEGEHPFAHPHSRASPIQGGGGHTWHWTG